MKLERNNKGGYQMELIESLNLLENKKVIFWLNIISIPLIVLFFAAFTFISLIVDVPVQETHTFNLSTTLLSLVAFFLLIILHEVIHGIFFKLFNPEAKVKYGFKNGMAYATSPNSFYTKGKFVWICLAPFIIITFILFFLLYFGIITPTSFALIASLHAAACVGDFYWVYLIIRLEKGAYVEDTEVGISFYRKAQ